MRFAHSPAAQQSFLLKGRGEALYVGRSSIPEYLEVDLHQDDALRVRIEILKACLSVASRWDEVREVMETSHGRDDLIDSFSERFNVSSTAATAMLDSSIRIFTPWFQKQLREELSALENRLA